MILFILIVLQNKGVIFVNIKYYKEYSHHLNRDMEFKVYGHSGQPILIFPCQDGRFYDFENFNMVYSIEH